MSFETQLFSTFYKVLRRIQQPQPGTPGRTPSLSKSALGYFTCVTQHMGPTALRPIPRMKQWLSVLLKDTSVTAGDSNPQSADQKHQSLNSVRLTARPRHFSLIMLRSSSGECATADFKFLKLYD